MDVGRENTSQRTKGQIVMGRMVKRVVARPRLSPKFEGPLEWWTINHIKQNLFRTAPYYDFEDLMAEARYVFVKCRRAYPNVRTPAHFATLYRTAFTNQVHKIAAKRTTKHQATCEASTQEWKYRQRTGRLASAQRSNWMEYISSDGGATGSFSTAGVHFGSHYDDDNKPVGTPEAIQRIIYYLTESQRPPKRRNRETMNQFLCRVAKVSWKSRDMVLELLDHLKLSPEVLCA